MHYLWYILILLIFSGCSSRESETSHSFRIYKENGVSVAETNGGPKFEGDLFRYEKLYDLHEDERDASILWRPRTPSVNKDGNMFVPESGDDRIAVFDSQGKYIYDIGHSGEGPGEFRSISIQEILNDQIHIFDRINRRLNIFKLDGELIRVLPLPSLLTNQTWAYYPVDEDRFVALMMSTTMFEDQELNTAGAVVFNAGRDSISSISSPPIPGAKIAYKRQGTAVFFLPSVYSYYPTPHVCYSSQHGIIVSTGHEPILHVFDVNGTLLSRITIDLPPQPVNDSDRQLAIADMEEWEANNPMRSSKEMRNAIADAEFAETKPFWHTIHVDNYGYIWLTFSTELHSDLDGVPEPERILLSPEGEYLGRTTCGWGAANIHYGLMPKLLRNDDTGEATLSLYRLIPSIPAFS